MHCYRAVVFSKKKIIDYCSRALDGVHRHWTALSKQIWTTVLTDTNSGMKWCSKRNLKQSMQYYTISRVDWHSILRAQNTTQINIENDANCTGCNESDHGKHYVSQRLFWHQFVLSKSSLTWICGAIQHHIWCRTASSSASFLLQQCTTVFSTTTPQNAIQCH